MRMVPSAMLYEMETVKFSHQAENVVKRNSLLLRVCGPAI